jgi:hypothetical protein
MLRHLTPCKSHFSNPPLKKTLSSQCFFRDWIPEAKDELMWLSKIDKYFNSCKTIDEEREINEEGETES